MDIKYRGAKRIILSIFLILFSLFIIAAFTDSWQTGLIWLMASLSLIIILISYNRPGPRRLSREKKILLIILFGIFFIVGALFLPETVSTERNVTNKSELSEKQDSEKELVKEIIIPKNIFKDSIKLNEIRDKWASDIIKEWKGSYIENFITSKDRGTIYFQLTKTASKGNWKIDAELHESILQEKFDKIISEKFNNESIVPNTVISLIPNEQQSNINSAKKEREEVILRQFSLWDGSNRHLERYIKNNMNDPDCYEHIATNYIDKNEYILVNTKIRGCNTFGAKIVQTISANIDLQGNIISIQ